MSRIPGSDGFKDVPKMTHGSTDAASAPPILVGQEKSSGNLPSAKEQDRRENYSLEADQSMDVDGFFTENISETGSFDIWGGIWATTFGKVLQSLPIPAFLVDGNHQVRVANQACARISPLYGAKLGTRFYELVPDATAGLEARSIVDRVFLMRKSIVTEMVLRIDAKRIWGRLTFRSIRIGDERLVLVLVEDLTRERHQLEVNEKLRAELENRVLERTEQLRKANEQLRRQIMEREKAEDALRESEARYRDLFENASDAIYTHDLDGNYTSGNKAVESIIGYPRDEFLTLNFRDIVHLEDLPKAEESIIRKSEHIENKVGPHEIRLRVQDGSLRWIEFTSRFLMEDEKPVAVQGSARDISDRKLLEEKLRQAAKMEAIGHLAGGIAHDFNNLLTAMLGYTEMLDLEVPESSSFKEKLAHIKDAAHKAANLTQQLLAFGRKQLLELKPLNINTVVDGFEKMLRRVIAEDIAFETHYEPSVATVHADPGQIEQILMNLGVNARDAMPQGGQLTIKTGNVCLDGEHEGMPADLEPGHYVMLEVADNGVGMDDLTLSRVFDPFFTTKKKGFGTGLGLSTVYGIVKQHGGHIAVQSGPGSGTTFRIYFPQVEGDREMTVTVSAEQSTPSGTETILVVEDEASILSLTSDALQMLGYKTMTAQEPKMAEEISSGYDGPIDLLLTDVVLPQMDGRSMYGRLLGSRPGMKVLFMSGHTDDFIVHHGVLDAGVQFLRKPFTVQALAKKVREVIDNQG